jgi:hypothetical protein
MTSKQAAELFRRAGANVPADVDPTGHAKHGNKKTTLDGKTFDSAIEARAYVMLKSVESAGLIGQLELQPRFVLQEKAKGRRAIEYVADFRFVDWSGADGHRWRTVDVKGFKTAMFKLKMKLMAEKHPLVEVELWDRAKVKELERRWPNDPPR